MTKSALFLIVCSVGAMISIRYRTITQLEDEAVGFIIASADLKGVTGLDKVLELTEAIALFAEPRRNFADNNGFKKDKEYLSQSPILASLAYGGGACGYATEIGVRVFEMEGYKARFTQVLNRTGNTHHVVMDVLLQDSIEVVIDPIFGHAFMDSFGQPIGIESLQSNWETHKLQLPENKIRSYSYEHGTRHTNWEKNGLTRFLRASLSALGSSPEKVCLRKLYNQLRRTVPTLTLILSLAGMLFYLFQLNRKNE